MPSICVTNKRQYFICKNRDEINYIILQSNGKHNYYIFQDDKKQKTGMKL
jgi:hypothetical protein